MPPFPTFRPFGLRRNDRSKRVRRFAGWTAAVGAIALLAGILQTASAQEGLVVTDTALTSSSPNNTSLINEIVTYTATVTVDGSETRVTEGNVAFMRDVSGVDEAIPECAAVEVGLDGTARCSQTYTLPGTHIISAIYTDDQEPPVFDTSTSSDLTQTVKAASSTVLSSSDDDDTTVSGEPVLYTATVSSDYTGATPTGSVTFQKDGANITGCVEIGLSTGQTASCPTKFAKGTAGDVSYVISAVYSGDPTFAGSPSNSITQSVGQAATTTLVSSQPTRWVRGRSITYTAAVAPVDPSSGEPPPTGTVTFTHGATTICSEVTLSGGTAACSYTHNSTGSQTITAQYSGDSNYASSNDDITQVVNLPYLVTSSLSGSSSEPTNASFRVSGGPARSYTLCVRLLGTWRSGPRDDLRTPEPDGGEPGESWATKWTLNTNDRCRGFTWNSGSASTQTLYPDFGFAAKGTYQVTLKIEGDEIDTATVNWNSWCPPSALRDIGVWRPSRLKTLDSCKGSSGYVGKGGSRSSLDADLGWRWMSGLGRLHVEYVAMDSGWYSNPTTGGTPLLRSPGGAGTDNRWTLWGHFQCDTYHGWKEFHRVYMAQQGNAIFISGAQYSTKTPSVSGTWSAHKC
jgi:hypothetical protein